MTNPTTALAAQPRRCAQCEGLLPADASPRRIYCHVNCSRKAVYWRKSPADRAAINKRSNDRRFKQDLLPLIVGLQRTPSELKACQPVAEWAVMAILVDRHSNWKLDLALNYGSVRNALAGAVGGHEKLEEIEQRVNEAALRTVERQLSAAARQGDRA